MALVESTAAEFVELFQAVVGVPSDVCHGVSEGSAFFGTFFSICS